MTTIVAGERCQCSGFWKWQLWKLTLEYKSSRLKQRSRCRVNSLVIQQGGKSLRMGLWGSCIRTQKQKSRTLAFWLQLLISNAVAPNSALNLRVCCSIRQNINTHDMKSLQNTSKLQWQISMPSLCKCPRPSASILTHSSQSHQSTVINKQANQNEGKRAPLQKSPMPNDLPQMSIVLYLQILVNPSPTYSMGKWIQQMILAPQILQMSTVDYALEKWMTQQPVHHVTTLCFSFVDIRFQEHMLSNHSLNSLQ